MTEKFRFRDLQQAWGVGRTFEVSLNDLYPEPESDAEDLFAYIFDIAEINKAGGGIMWMGHRILSTRYVLGSNVPDETPPG